ncbi:MAG: primosomal protein N' [Paraprevotella sp.]|nr:primosomal protein N' [Paraprevotella sp.]
MSAFADVIVPLPLSGRFTYRIPEALVGKVAAGYRVIVPFGSRKFYTALVEKVHTEPSGDYEMKDLVEVLDNHPVLLPGQLRFWQWLADYYMCTVGEVYKAALPSGMKLESETVVTIEEDFVAENPFSPRELQVWNTMLRKPAQTITQIGKESGLKNVLPVVRRLMECGAIKVKEEVKRSFRPKTRAYVALAPDYFDEARLSAVFDELRKAPKQLTLLMKYVEMSGTPAALTLHNSSLLKDVPRADLLEAAGASSAVLAGLVRRGVLALVIQEVGRLAGGLPLAVVPLNPLSEGQRRAFDDIVACFSEKDVCLLHGVTSSGKTEVYIHLISKMLKQQKQVLYLLPEIVLTTQLTERLKRVFGDKLGIYHSKYPDAERVEIWQKQLSDTPYDIIVGVRSSVFLPFRQLGLVIVDEEHEATYKQQDPAPRYHARNAAIVLASFSGAKTLLGTATPSLESYYNACTGKYGLVTLGERFGQVRLPEVEIVDIKELHRKRRMTGPFSPVLLGAMQQALAGGEQVILFQNRRGFAPMLECHVCGWVPKCRNCDVSLTYHKRLNQLTCHYCGYTYSVPACCPACGSAELDKRGFGTEKIEDDIQLLFPEAKVARMDMDTTRTRQAYERIIADFQSGRTDILIGTQMVTKGLDFGRVSVVGILNADTLLNYPDFRSYERAFQMMTQVAGRAGRRNRQGRVILQTKTPDLPLIGQVVANDYDAMFRNQMEERNMFHYPPFCRLICLYMKHRDERVLDSLAVEAASRLRQLFGGRVLGPDMPPVARVQMFHIRKILLKVETDASVSRVREALGGVINSLTADERYRSAIIYFDVDPL